MRWLALSDWAAIDNVYLFLGRFIPDHPYLGLDLT